MGILLKDQKVLYASENLGQIDVDDSPVIPTVVPVTSVMISTPSQYLGTEVGSTLQLTATVSPASAPDKSVSWSSSNPSIATVSNTGLVTRTAPLTSDDGQPLPVTITARAVNGVTGSIVLQAAVLQLPADAFAVFDGIVGAREAIAGQWQDMSGNGRHLPIVDGNDTPNYWSADHPDSLNCDCNNHSTSALLTDMPFVPENGLTLCALIGYDVSASDFHHGQYTTNNGHDYIFGVHKSPLSVQMGIGARHANDQQLIVASKDSTGEWTRHFTTAADLSGVKLITWAMEPGDGETSVKVYVDGMLHESLTITNAVAGSSSPSLSFFAANSISDPVNNVVNFFGQVYGVAVYNRALTATEVAAVRTYYQERYNHYYTDSNES